MTSGFKSLRATEADGLQPIPRLRSAVLPGWAVAALGSVTAGVGLFTVYGSVRMLLEIWRTDELKSMGLLVPFLSFGLILREWRRLGWETEGTWWGFAVLAASALLMFFREHMLLIVTAGSGWLLQIPPLPLLAVIYGLGMVLLFGGRRLLRAAWFPVLFLWAVIPVPQSFSTRIDLPLQHAAATVARSFAHALGTPLTEDNLRLMFTPDFGFFIAPGCNGIRGAITLGLAAIVISFVYRFRWYLALPVVAGAVGLGYVFNLVRLCTLVVYARTAVRFPALQPHEQTADHIVGGTLFVLALLVFFSVADRLKRPRSRPTESPLQPLAPRFAAPVLLRVAAVALLAIPFGLEAIHTERVEAASLRQTIAPVPDHIGAYRLVRTFEDTLLEGTVVYTWGEYAPPEPAAGDTTPLNHAHIAVGFSPVMDIHDVEVCHLARGDEPTSRGELTAATGISGSPGASAARLTTATYRNGQVQTLEASTVCSGGVCRQFTENFGDGRRHVTLIYTHPRAGLPGQQLPSRPVPVLMKVESEDVLAPVGQVRLQMEAALERFLRQGDLAGAAEPFTHRVAQ